MIRALAFASTLTLCSLAAAQPAADPAEAAYQEGKKLYDVQDWDGAIAKFREAYRIRGDQASLFNIAQAYRLKGDCTGAVTAYKTYKRNFPNADNIPKVDKFISDLEATCKAGGTAGTGAGGTGAGGTGAGGTGAGAGTGGTGAGGTGAGGTGADGTGAGGTGAGGTGTGGTGAGGTGAVGTDAAGAGAATGAGGTGAGTVAGTGAGGTGAGIGAGGTSTGGATSGTAIVGGQTNVDDPNPGRTKVLVGYGLVGVGLIGVVTGAVFAGAARSKASDVTNGNGEWDPEVEIAGLRNQRNSRIGFVVGGLAAAAGVTLVILGRRQNEEAERAQSTRLTLAPSLDGGQLVFSGRW